MVAPLLQEGITRAKGRSSKATLNWAGMKKIKFVSTYLETGGKLSEHNLQIISDIAKELAENGELYWLGGDFQVDSSWLEELGWLKTIHGRLRVGDKRVGTCTSKVPATSIDYHIIHKKLDDIVTQAEINLDTGLSPHRPVAATLQLTDGKPVPVQYVLKLPTEGVVGPQRENLSYMKANQRMKKTS